MQEKLLSVIMPIFNADEYLENSINSVLKQKYSNFQLILIDDGSTDSSSDICDKFAVLDKRIQVLHKKNEGVAEARNDGLGLAKGEYITFVDSDDIVSNDMFKQLIKNLEENKADISICNYQEFNNKIPYLIENKCKEINIYSNEEAIQKLNLESKFTLALWGKVYRKKLFDGEKFPNIPSSEDNEISYHLLYKAKRIVYCERKYYFYRKNNNSITHRKDRVNIQILYEGVKTIEFIKNNMYSQYESTIYKYLFLVLGVYNTMIQKNIFNKKYEEDILKYVKIWNKIIKKKIKYTNKQKSQVKLFLLSRKLYKFIYRIKM